MKSHTAYPDWTAPRPQRRASRHRRHEAVNFRLWLPLTPLCLLLAPLAWLLLPIVALCCFPWRLNPIRLLAGIGGVLLSMGGTEVNIQAPDALVRIRIF